MKINIHIKNQDNFIFGLMIVGLVIVWFAFALFTSETIRSPETEEWLESQPAQPSSGMEW